MTLTERERLLLGALDRMDVLLDVMDGEYPEAEADEDDLRAVLPLLDEAALRELLDGLLKPIATWPSEYPNIPTVTAELVNETQLRIRCDWCRAYHWHGAGDPAGSEFPIYGHRVEHCHRPAGPYARFGYWLVPAPEDAP